MKICPRCQTANADNAVFCQSCGLRPTASTPKSPIVAPLKPISNKKIAYIVLLIAIPLGLLVGVAGYVAEKEKSQQIKPVSLAASVATLPQTSIRSQEASFQNSSVEKIIEGKVVAIADGDTITVLDSLKKQHKIRLEGIDAPESSQAFGEKAKQNLSSLIFGKEVTIKSNKTDKYGRTVGKVILNGQDINLEQLKSGFAWHYKAYESEQTAEDRKLYSDAELQARDLNIGLWSQPNYIAPWDFRKGTTANVDETKIYGNKNSRIYHWAGCPGFVKIAEKNRIVFESVEEAESAGYRAAKNCSTPKPEAEESLDQSFEPTLEASVEDNSSTPEYYRAPVSTPTPEIPTTTYVPPSQSVRPRKTRPPSTSPAGASAKCADGTYSYSRSRRGTCSHHGGVAEWLSSSIIEETELENSDESIPSYSTPGSDLSRPKTVYVRGYTRKNGTYVAPYMRSAPRRKN